MEYERWMGLNDAVLDDDHVQRKQEYLAWKEKERLSLKPIKNRVAAKISLVRGAIGTAPYEGQEVVTTGEVARFRNALYLAGDNEARERYADLELVRIFGEVKGKELIDAVNQEHEGPK